jgi:hypothetical protein
VDLIQFYCTSNRREKALLSARQHQQNARNNHHKKITEQNKRHVVVVVVVGGLAAWDGTVRYPFRTPVIGDCQTQKKNLEREKERTKKETHDFHIRSSSQRESCEYVWWPLCCFWVVFLLS